MAMQFIDPSDYSGVPLLDVAGGISLTTSLKTAMPAKMPVTVKSAAREMVAAADALADAWSDEPVPTVDDRRPADAAIDRAWGAFHSRLVAYSTLPTDRYKESAEAANLVRTLFPDGLAFLRLPYNQEWAESAKRLKKIADDNLEDTLNDLAGEEFLAEIRRAHEVYGEVLGITKVAPAAQSPVRAERLRELRRLMNRYVVRVLAQLDDDAESQAMVRQALQPIDDFRAAQARRAVSSAAEEPEAEGPQVVGGAGAPVAPVVAPGNGAAPVAVPGAPNSAPS
jgi:hypothetical protein